jgi:cytochrome c oxidase subunit 2
MWDFPLFPDRASTIAGEVDLLFFALIGLSLVFIVAIVACIFYFAVKYRRGSHADRSNPVNESLFVETTWMIIPTVLGVGMFGWAATSYFDMQRQPSGEAMEIYATGKQWMWKFQHPGGAREINTLHVPAGRPIEVTLTSQDVIHSFFVPAFRIKQDALPGRYTKTWFEATKPGTYHLLCAEYCGTEHSQMGGKVHVMEPAAYAQWLETGATGGSNTEPGTGRRERTPTGGLDDPSEEPMDPDARRRNEQEPPAPPPQAMAEAGRQLFEKLRCNSCHRVDSTALYPATGPVLEGLYGHPAELQNNRTIIADAQYIRTSILYPQQKLVAGYPPVMPTYKGQINEDELMQLVAYIKSLSEPRETGSGTRQPPPATAAPNSQSYD